MIPINYDLLISTICWIAGLIAAFRIGAFSKCQYTPTLSAITILSGLVAWSIIGLVSFSAVFEHPALFFSEGWKGSWGYTSSRFFMAITWFLTLLLIEFYAPKRREDVLANI